jgi:hypothetical protein
MGRNSHNKLIEKSIGWRPAEDLESGIRAQRDKVIGKSSDAEVQKAFGESNKPTSNNVNPATTPQQSVPLNNSTQQPTNMNYSLQLNQSILVKF